MKTYIVILTTGARICVPHCQCSSTDKSVSFFRIAAPDGEVVIIAEFFTPALAGYHEI